MDPLCAARHISGTCANPRGRVADCQALVGAEQARGGALVVTAIDGRDGPAPCGTVKRSSNRMHICSEING